MAFQFKNKKAFDRKLKAVSRTGQFIQKDLAKEIPIDYIFVLARNTSIAPARDDEGKKIKGRGLAKSAWYQMLPEFGKKSSTRRRLPPGSSEVTKKKRKNKNNIVLTNAIEYIEFLDIGGQNTPPSNILRKSEIEMEKKTEKRLKKSGKELEKIWRR